MKRVPFVSRRYTKGVAFLKKWYIIGQGIGPRSGDFPHKTLLITRAIYVQMTLTFFLLEPREFKLTTPAPGKGPYFTSVSRNNSQLAIIAGFHTTSRRPLTLAWSRTKASLSARN